MEQELKTSLRLCAMAYAEARGIGLSTIGRLAAGDGSFFKRVDDDDKSFTIRTYDEVMDWFAANWPEGTRWPKGVARPPSSPLPKRHPEPARARS